MNTKFIVNRIVYTLIMFIFVITLNFFLFRLMPGDPLSMVAKETGSSADAIAAIEHKYGLDLPLHQQYFKYVGQLIRLDFGNSFHYKESVIQVLKPRIINSLILGAAAVPLGVIIGLLGGVFAAAWRGKKLDMVLTSTTMFIYAIPSFWLGMILLSIFAVKFKLVPLNGMVTAGISHGSSIDMIKDLFHHMIIPMITYALAIYGGYLLIMRGAMIDVYTEDYILTAQAKGLSRRDVIFKHAVPNAMLPVVTIVVLTFATIFVGAFSIEVLFSWPGMGRLMVDSVSRRDYPVMQATNFLIATAVIFANLIIDILYRYLDPRVRLD